MTIMVKKGLYGIGVVGPFMVMVVMEGCSIGLTILTKTAMANYGMSPFVFIVYTNVIASLLLLPHAFISLSDRSVLTFPLLLRFFFMGLTGVTMAQNLAFVGLSYSSPYMVCAMGLLIPSFSFIISIILRRARRGWRSSSFRNKVVGSMMSIMGASMVIFYKGPVIQKASLSSIHGHQQHFITRFLVFSSTTPQYWVLGGFLLAAASLSISVWNIIQMETVKKYPEVMRIVSFYSIIGTVQCVAVSLYFERDPNAWKLKLNKELLLIAVTAVFGSMVRTRIQVWCMQAKGPFYVPMFKPFGIVFATSFGVAFFATTLHYGSVIATCIIGMGYYTLMWGQIKEEEELNDDKKVPLLQDEDSKV